MKNILILVVLLILASFAFAQGYKYAWITDTHIGSPNADKDLEAVINDIKKNDDIKFVVVTGDIAEKGRNTELELAKQLFNKLNKNYYVIPGNHDTKWSESGTTKIKELWGNTNNFIFDFQTTRHIGINSGIPWRGGGGHVSPEDLEWLKTELEQTPKEKEIVFYIHHPLDGDVDNWFAVTNLLTGYNVKAIFIGHGHANRLMSFAGIPAAMGRSTLSRPKFPGYTLVDYQKDVIQLFEVKVDSIPHLWGTIETKKRNDIVKIDSLQFIKYSPKVEFIWQKDQKKSFSTSLLVEKNRIYSTSIDGDVSCFDVSGHLIWQVNLGRTIFSRPAIFDEILAVATIEGDLFTINSSNGDVLQTMGINDALTSQLTITEIEYNGEKVNAVIVGTAKGKIYCYELKNLELIWENNSAAQMIETMPLVIQDKVIFGSWDNYLYCINKNSGTLIWKWTENKNFYYSPAACFPVSDDKNVFVSTPDKFISAIDLQLGTTTWRKQDFNSWESIGISRAKNKIFVKSMLDKFFIASARDGKLIKEIKVGFSLDTMPIQLNDWNDIIIFGGKNGVVYMIDKSYNVNALFFMGTCRIHSIQHVEGDIFAASNMDGKIVLFKILPDAK